MLIAAILTSGELERRDTPPIRRGDGRVRFCKPATAPPPYEMHGMRSEKPVELQQQPPFDFNGMLALVDAADLHEHDPRRKTFETGRFEKSFYVELRASSSAGT